MSGFLGLRGLPRGGRQLGHPGDRPLSELGKYVPEIFSEIDIQASASFHDRRDGGDLRSGLRAADMQPIFAAECQRTNRSFYAEMPIMPSSRSDSSESLGIAPFFDFCHSALFAPLT